MKILNIMIALICVTALAGCMSKTRLKKEIAEIVKEDPKVLTDAIEANPVEFVEAFQRAIRTGQAEMRKRQEQAEKKKLEDAYDNPLTPKIRGDEYLGNKDAPLLLVMYSDFECPFCTRGYKTVKALMERYGKNIMYIYKHLPLSFHQNAMIAAKYYEAIRIQDKNKAYKFHDKLFEAQSKLKNGEKFLKKLAKQVGANMGKLAKDLKSSKVEERIKEDLQEAASFGMQGTPGFLLNGIPVKGAYPESYFINIVEELKKRGKIKL